MSKALKIPEHELEPFASDLAYEIVNHPNDEVCEPELLTKIIENFLNKLLYDNTSIYNR